MAKQITFTNLLLDDNNEITSFNSNKKDDSKQQAIFSITDSKWNEISSNEGNKNTVQKFDLFQLFSSIFLPIGYPSSVTSDYGVFQMCDTIQALCSYLRGLLCSRSTLIGIGVGQSTANATSATIQFIFRDLTGLIGSVLFSWKYSYSFGIEIKQWRLFADVINDIALTLELMSPLFPSICFVPILCIASVCKAMCGCCAGATRVGIAKHFAKNDNETDLISKEGIQETFVTVLGMIFGLIFTSCLNNNEYEFIIIVATFVSLTIVHVVANYFAVKSLQLNTLNRERLNIIITHYLTHKNDILTPKEVCNYENVWNLNLFPLNYITNFIFNSQKDKCFQLNLGIKINHISAVWMEWNLNVFKNNNKQNYYFNVIQKGKCFNINIAYNVNATDIDFIESFLIYKIIKEWIWNKVKNKKNCVIKPDLSLKLLSEKEMIQFKKMLKESVWKISNLRLSLSVNQNRYDIQQ